MIFNRLDIWYALLVELACNILIAICTTIFFLFIALLDEGTNTDSVPHYSTLKTAVKEEHLFTSPPCTSAWLNGGVCLLANREQKWMVWV